MVSNQYQRLHVRASELDIAAIYAIYAIYALVTLIAALLEHCRLLPEPLLYLSGYLKQHQAEYYRRL